MPTDVLETAAAALLNYNGTGLGVAEHSHRSGLAADIVNTTKADLIKFLDIPDDYEVLFLQAGGSGEFAATVYNMVGQWVVRQKEIIEIQRLEEIKEETVLEELQAAVKNKLKIDYIITGSWSLKASQEASSLLGPEHVNIAADARTAKEDNTFGKIPGARNWKLSKDAAMVYYCDNETVDGVEFDHFPEILNPTKDGGPYVVADMSSNILSRKIPVAKFSAIFFGAQKNLGITGVTVAIVKKSLIAVEPEPKLMRQLGLPVRPSVWSYKGLAKDNSLYNTLSIFE